MNERHKQEINVQKVQRERDAMLIQQHIDQIKELYEQHKEYAWENQVQIALEREERVTEDPYLVSHEIDEGGAGMLDGRAGGKGGGCDQ